MAENVVLGVDLDEYKYGFRDEENYVFKSRKGLDHEIVDEISWMKGEPDWMRAQRHKALDIFFAKPVPTWGGDLSRLDYDDIYYYIKPVEQQGHTWDEVPDGIKRTFDRLGIPEAERKFLAGAGAQYESEAVYHNLKEEWERQGVIFVDSDTGLREYEEFYKEYFGTVVPAADNKYAALNTATWSGGSFVYVPKGVKVQVPLQAYFRINAQNMGQFERTLIIADEGSQVQYIEGCTAPTYSTNSFHSGVIEIIVKKGARVRYTTIQNWSHNVYNLVTQRAMAYEDATMEWVDGNMGCLAEGSTVTTPEGIKRIENLVPGEQVLSLDEASGRLCFRPVLAQRFSGLQPIREISHGERKLLATSNHPFYSYHYAPDRAKKVGRYQLGYVRADELTEAIIPCTSIDYGRPHDLVRAATTTAFVSSNQYSDSFEATRARQRRVTIPDQTTDDLMWLFGLFLGDGDIYREPGKTPGLTRYAKVGFSIPRHNRARDKLVTLMSGLIEQEATERADKVHLLWNSVELADFFEQNGFESGAAAKRIPAWVFSTPESQRLALLAGYIDADGCVIQRRFSIESVNRELLDDVARLATSLGITTRIFTEHAEPREVVVVGNPCISRGSHRITFPLDERLLPYLTTETREKVEATDPAQLMYHRRIGRSNIELPDSVEIVPVSVGGLSVDKVPTWDIEVAGTGNFVSEGFIVHNSRLTMKYPSVYMMGKGARAEILSIAFANTGQHQDAGGKAIHGAPHTSSSITSKSISKGGGRAAYRGLIKAYKGAHGVKSNVVCDALILDDKSRSDTYPVMEIDENDASVSHEATVSKVSDEQLFYLQSRGIPEAQAMLMIVNGFIEPIVKELPMEYAVELNRLIQLEMEGSVG
jgi:Fe-S cluster assembly scaffold protein SufB